MTVSMTTGGFPYDRPITTKRCPECGGIGRSVCRVCLGTGSLISGCSQCGTARKVSCGSCTGTGEWCCPACKGAGRVRVADGEREEDGQNTLKGDTP